MGWWFAIFASVASKTTMVLAVAWLVAFALRGRSAAARHLVWTAAAAAVLALPFLSVSLPVLPVPAPAGLAANFVFRTTVAAGADMAATPGPQAIGAAPIGPGDAGWRPDWRLVAMLLWAAGALAALLRMMVGF